MIEIERGAQMLSCRFIQRCGQSALPRATIPRRFAGLRVDCAAYQTPEYRLSGPLFTPTRAIWSQDRERWM